MAMRILLTNDDGIGAKGILNARDGLKEIGEVWVVAPDQDKSGVSHSLTLRQPLRVEEKDDRTFVVSGTPTDCVLLAYHHFIKGGIDLVIAGVNHGYNMGYDVFYSGTVAAALQGGILGIRSMAVSSEDIESAVSHLNGLVEQIMDMGDENVVLNINVPRQPRGLRITRLGKRIYQDEVIKKETECRVGYYVIDGTLSFELGSDTDFEAIEHGLISITPLNLDLTDHKVYEEMKRQFHLQLNDRLQI
ncbi:MAG TPA: 5'/3'-nucleotidase SurE [bacterium (Candidatus Stahlbacteria)]|nr:5'/3'-nucleotidase SurE [Candidatus Stahlbacteria bacterium]